MTMKTSKSCLTATPSPESVYQSSDEITWPLLIMNQKDFEIRRTSFIM